MCSWVGSRGVRAPARFEAAEWPRFDGLCEGLEGVLAMSSADALRRIEELRVETDRISERIRDDIEPREREEGNGAKARDAEPNAEQQPRPAPREQGAARRARPRERAGGVSRTQGRRHRR